MSTTNPVTTTRIIEMHGRTPLLAVREEATGHLLTYLDVHDVDKLCRYYAYDGPRNMSRPEIVPILLHEGHLFAKTELDWQTPEYQAWRRERDNFVVCSPHLNTILGAMNTRREMQLAAGETPDGVLTMEFFDRYLDVLSDADHEARNLIALMLPVETRLLMHRTNIVTYHGYPSINLQRDLTQRRIERRALRHLIDHRDQHLDDPYGVSIDAAMNDLAIELLTTFHEAGVLDEAIRLLGEIPDVHAHNRHAWAPDLGVEPWILMLLSSHGCLYRLKGDALAVSAMGRVVREFARSNRAKF